jgi:hypothetical protein
MLKPRNKGHIGVRGVRCLQNAVGLLRKFVCFKFIRILRLYGKCHTVAPSHGNAFHFQFGELFETDSAMHPDNPDCV